MILYFLMSADIFFCFPQLVPLATIYAAQIAYRQNILPYIGLCGTAC